MSTDVKVGISDIAIYLPRLKIDLEAIIKKRASESDGKTLEKILNRTLAKTGLFSMHFPEFWEDSVTMAAQAALKLVNRKNFNLNMLRYLVSGTETGVDHSKPLASYVVGILKKAGVSIPQSISTFQTQHACAGGTVALMAISALLGFTHQPGESGIVLCSDIARYGKCTSAEMTQGAGAIALLTETNPKLVELDLKTAGYSSKDVDDFFRPLGSEIAKVKGGLSIRCYMEAMDSALVGDLALFYHSNAKPSGVAGVCEVTKTGVPDYTSWDPKSKYYDPKTDPDDPRWIMVEVKFVEKFPAIIPLSELRKVPALKDMKILQKGSRLSITPLQKKEFEYFFNK